MKKTTQISALVIAALVATGVTSSVAAQDNNPREERRAEMFAELDTNKDGNISAEEFAARKDRFARLDTDGNGLLSAEEMIAGGQERAERRVAKMIERLDSNGDGSLSQEEIEARRDPARIFERLDANDDGMVSAEEFAEARMGHGGGKKHRGKW